jgi:hypothetical protein
VLAMLIATTGSPRATAANAASAPQPRLALHQLVVAPSPPPPRGPAWAPQNPLLSASGDRPSSAPFRSPALRDTSSTGWTAEHTPNFPLKEGQLTGDSCSLASACIAVGYYINSPFLTAAFAEKWNGSSWSLQKTPSPPGSTGSALDSVACSSPTACIAVGYYVTSLGDFALAEAWNGKSWSLQKTPIVKGSSHTYLHGVACSSATACTAVGYYQGNLDHPIVLGEVWNGKSWSVKQTPQPKGSTDSELSAVACTAPTACTAVGDYEGSSGVDATLAEAWNGKSWTVKQTPNPSGSAGGSLDGVACSSRSACSAVGYYQVPSGVETTLAEKWNGNSWSLQPAPSPSGSADSILSSVACSSPAACIAVGHYRNRSGVDATLAEAWNGKSWTVKQTPNPSGSSDSYLYGAACIAANGCTAVGEHNEGSVDRTLAELWNGISWSRQPTPNPSALAESALGGVVCRSPRACTAVGAYEVSSGIFVTLAEAWNGTSWSRQPTPNAPGAVDNELDGLACTSATFCIAVGYYEVPSGDEFALAERWNGSSWSRQPTANPSGSTASSLTGVACTSASDCTAVGTYFNSSSDEFTLAEAWNGTSWSVQQTPNPSISANELRAVACVSPSDCTAVGSFQDNSGDIFTLAEGWNGTNWLLEQTPNPSGSPASDLNGVACTSDIFCTAVGAYEGSVIGGTLAEEWNGISWSVQQTPNASGADVSELWDVACTSASACTAVGDGYHNSQGIYLDLAEEWNGTSFSWSVQQTPNPSALNDRLFGVACTSASACTAVGEAGFYQALVLAEG